MNKCFLMFRTSWCCYVHLSVCNYHGQWWSILRMHRLHTLQWCALSGFMLQHFGHLKKTWPSLKPNCWIISFVAFPFGTAPLNSQIEMKIWNEISRVTHSSMQTNPIHMEKSGTVSGGWVVHWNLLTGSENIVRICDAYAKNANKLKMTILMVLYTGYGLGSIITTITTNSAYKINNHVIIAQIMPQISYRNKKFHLKKSIKHKMYALDFGVVWTHLNAPSSSATTAIMHVFAVKQFVFIIHITSVIMFLSKF